ncbi:MAG: alpha-galactosidase [Sphaerochaetaceae bacterium]|nr:alpha-galactosidase [Sphaerochaetaceae bacterium]
MDYRVQYRRKSDGRTVLINKPDENLDISFKKTEGSLEMSVSAKSAVTLDYALLENILKIKKADVFFLNGYQSWTDSREVSLQEGAKEKDVRKIPGFLNRKFFFDRYGDSVFYDYRPSLVHGYDVFYVKGVNGFFSFNRNFENAFAIYEVDKQSGNLSVRSDVKGIELEKGESCCVFNLYTSGNYEEGLKAFRSFFCCSKKKKIAGYTSWYNHYQNINEEIISSALENMDERFDLFQIDDGYETFIGDWLEVDEKKFPEGLKKTIDRIHGKGKLAGIWMAPFVAETKSRLFREHPQWIRKDRNGNYACCGSNWSGFYALDLQNPEVLSYLKKCFDFMHGLGIDFFKLDFLYASIIEETPGMSRAQACRKSYALLRALAGDALILGCGAICFPSFGYFDYMRIGPDVSLSFDDVWYMRFMHRERISTKVTLQNTVYRSIFDGALFGNDPDVVLLRDSNISLTPQQREALITINSIFGSLYMTSDDVSLYDEKKKKLFSLCMDMFHNSSERSFEKHGKTINISCKYKDSTRKITYDVEKGILL